MGVSVLLCDMDRSGSYYWYSQKFYTVKYTVGVSGGSGGLGSCLLWLPAEVV